MYGVHGRTERIAVFENRLFNKILEQNTCTCASGVLSRLQFRSGINIYPLEQEIQLFFAHVRGDFSFFSLSRQLYRN